MKLGEFLRHKKLNIAIFVVAAIISVASVIYGNKPVSEAVVRFPLGLFGVWLYVMINGFICHKIYCWFKNKKAVKAEN
jgi:hypothetical protein